MSRPRGRLNPNGLSARSIDLLETEEAWVDYEYVALRLNANPESVRKALMRLRSFGLVDWRKPFGRYNSNTRSEWRKA